MTDTLPCISSGDALVEALRGPSTITHAAEAVTDAYTEATPVPLPSDFMLHDLEKFQPGRRRMRGNMATRQIGHFVQYAIQHQESAAAIFVNPDELSAQAVLNLGDVESPGHADNTAQLQLKRTPAYQALLACDQRGMQNQRQAAEWLEDWIDHIEFFGEPTYQEGGDPIITDAIKPGVALAAIRSMTVETARKVENEEKALGTTRSAFESVQASSKHTLPQRLVFTCRPADELQPRKFIVRITVITTGDTPMLRFGIQRLATHQAEMGDELVALINKRQTALQIDGGDLVIALPIYQGSYKRGD